MGLDELPGWAQTLWHILLYGAIGYCIGSLRDAHSKLNKLAARQERLMEMQISLLQGSGIDPVTMDRS